MLTVRSLLLLDLVVGVVVLARSPGAGAAGAPGAVLVVGATGGDRALLLARSRGRLGVQGTRGDSMLVDLRDRLVAQGEMPGAARGLVGRGRAALRRRRVVLRRLPGGGSLRRRAASSRWRWSTCPARASTPAPGRCCCPVRSAACSARSPHEEFLPADEPLPAAPGVGRGVRHGRARDDRPRSGEYVVSVAGHPPAVQFSAGSGRWRVSEASEGPLLGVFPDAKFVSRARPAGPRRRAAAVHRRPDREARPGHVGRHRQAARRGRAAGHQGLPPRRGQAHRPGGRRPTTTTGPSSSSGASDLRGGPTWTGLARACCPVRPVHFRLSLVERVSHGRRPSLVPGGPGRQIQRAATPARCDGGGDHRSLRHRRRSGRDGSATTAVFATGRRRRRLFHVVLASGACQSPSS